MRFIFYGNEVKWPVYIQKQPVHYSNGSARQIKWLTDKQFERAVKKLQKRRKNAR